MTKYIGWNMPGCLPEMEPFECKTFAEAKDAIFDELDRQADDNEDYHECERYADEAAFVSRCKDAPFTTSEMPDGYVYWVALAE